MLTAQQLCVSERQRSIHMVTEAIAVFAITPFLGWVATRQRPLTTAERAGIWAIVGGTLVVDGILLYRWWTQRQRA